MVEIQIYDMKPHDLSGGDLIVSVPHQGIGNVLLTDFLLENLAMDHTTAFDSDAFPPVAMLHGGRARFPVRIHADPKTKVAVLRCEFAPAAFLVRPLARAILDWAEARKIARIVSLDAMYADSPKSSPRPRIMFAASSPKLTKEAAAKGLARHREGALGGVPALLLLLGQVRRVDHLALAAVLSDVEDDVSSAQWMADVLPDFIPPLDIDQSALEETIGRIAKTVAGLQQEIRRTVERMRTEEEKAQAPPPSMYR